MSQTATPQLGDEPEPTPAEIEEGAAQPAPEPAEEETGGSKGTNYVLLLERALGEDVVYVPVGKKTAASGLAAIRAFVKERLEDPEAPNPSGRYAAVPERSWDPQPVEIETTIKIG